MRVESFPFRFESWPLETLKIFSFNGTLLPPTLPLTPLATHGSVYYWIIFLETLSKLSYLFNDILTDSQTFQLHHRYNLLIEITPQCRRLVPRRAFHLLFFFYFTAFDWWLVLGDWKMSMAMILKLLYCWHTNVTSTRLLLHFVLLLLQSGWGCGNNKWGRAPKVVPMKWFEKWKNIP